MKKLWIAFAFVLFVSFSILGWIGTRIYEEAPPIVNKVVTTEGKVVIDAGEIQAGQNVWQTLGGMEVGSVWGHGSYVAPDWTADWLHREAVFILDRWAKSDFGTEFEKLDNEKQAQLSGRLATLMRTNTYDPTTQTVTVASDSCRGLRVEPRPLLRCVLERQDRLRHSCRCRDRQGSPASACRHFSFGHRGLPRPIDRTITSATRTTGPTSRWSPIEPRAKRSSGRA